MRNLDLVFWKKQISEGTILEAMRNHPEEARSFFGRLPFMRADPRELALIADARKILAASPEELKAEMLEIENSLREKLLNVPHEVHRRFSTILSALPEEMKSIANKTLDAAGAPRTKPKRSTE